MTPPEPSGGELSWLLDILGAHRAGAGGTAADYPLAVVPNAARPRLLIPAGARKPAATATRARDFGVPARTRVARQALALGLRLGVAQPLLRHHAALPLAPTDGEARDGPLLDYLRVALGGSELDVAVRVGRPRPNRKPLLSLHAADGGVIAFVKIGWNSITRSLVSNEARVLAHLGRRVGRVDAFAAPKVLHSGVWRDREVLVVSALDARRWTVRHVGATADALREIAGLWGPGQSRLGESRYWTDQRERVRKTALDSLEGFATRIQQAHHAEELAFCAVHGDWTPWNVGMHGHVLSVWDWERSGSVGPEGMDAAHFDFHRALADSRTSPIEATQRALGRGGLMLNEVGLTRSAAHLALSLDLLEMCLRQHEGAAPGAVVERSAHFVALEALLSRPSPPVD